MAKDPTLKNPDAKKKPSQPPRYDVHSPLRHNKKDYDVGSTVTMSAAAAAPLLEAGRISEVSN